MKDFVTKRILLMNLLPGMEISRPVITDEGRTVLNEGTIMTPSLVERLRQWGITSVHIKAEAEIEQEESPAQARQRVFADGYEELIKNVRAAFESMRYLKKAPIGELQQVAQTSIYSLVSIPGALNCLHTIKRRNDYTYSHSVHVATISGILGNWLGYGQEELKELILAGLLHDIGKTQVPLEILNKPGKLLPEEMKIMRKHTTRGFQLIQDFPDVSPGVMYGILQHHERLDGSGYPLGTTDEKIHPFAKIIAVADIYDAMTTDRCYQKSISPFSVVQTLVQEMFNKLDPEVCSEFLNRVRDYFVGSQVELSDGRPAEVLYLGRTAGEQPVVRTDDGEILDLEKCKNIAIKGILKA